MNQFVIFLREAWLELKQVAWLTTPQMVSSTIVVVVLVFIMSIYVLLVDKVLHLIIGILI